MTDPPNKIRFHEGQHKGLTFTRGKGPSHRIVVQNVVWLVNSADLWYSSFGGNFLPNRAIDARYLNDNRDKWDPAE